MDTTKGRRGRLVAVGECSEEVVADSVALVAELGRGGDGAGVVGLVLHYVRECVAPYYLKGPFLS